MKSLHLIAFLIAFLFTNFSHAVLWKSSTEKNYQASFPKLYIKYQKAQKLIDDVGSGNKENYDLAANILTSILQENKDFALAYYQYSRIMISQGYLGSPQGIKALKEVLNKAIEIEPNYDEPFIYFANMEQKLKNFTVARDYLEKARVLGTTSPWYDINMGRINYATGEVESALEHFENVAVRKDITQRTISFAFTELHKIYLEEKKYELADKYFKKIVEIQPNNAYRWGNYSMTLLYKLGRIDQAIEYLEKAVSLYPYKMAKNALAIAYYSKWSELQFSDLTLANEYYDKGMDVNSDIQFIYNETARNGYPVLEKTMTALQQKHGINGVRYVQPKGYKGIQSK